MVLMLTEKTATNAAFSKMVYLKQSPTNGQEIAAQGANRPFILGSGQPFPQFADELLEGFLH